MQKMKQIMYLIIGVMLLSINIVSADTNISIGVTTTEDINIWAYPNAIGETNYYFDGMNFQDTVNDLYGNDMSMKGIYWRISEIFMKQDYKKDWFIVNPLKLDRYEQRFRWTMDTYFVPRTEFNQLIDYTNSLDARITTLEEIVGLDKVLAKNKEFALENNLKDFVFRGKSYSRVGNDYVHIELKTIIQEKEINETEEVEIDLQQKQIDNWRRMCNSGMIQFCKILEQRGYNITE